jgi:hypothetical protein
MRKKQNNIPFKSFRGVSISFEAAVAAHFSNNSEHNCLPHSEAAHIVSLTK